MKSNTILDRVEAIEHKMAQNPEKLLESEIFYRIHRIEKILTDMGYYFP